MELTPNPKRALKQISPTQKALFGVAIVWIGLIWATSGTVVTRNQLATAVTSVLPITRADFLGFWNEAWWIFVKGWHATEFGLLFAFLSTVLTKTKLRHPNPLAFAIAVTCAFVDEFHQTFIPARGGRLSDVMIDAIGIILVCLLVTTTKDQKTTLRRTFIAIAAVGFIEFLSLHPFGTFPTFGC